MKVIAGDTVKILDNTYTDVVEGTIGKVVAVNELAAGVLVSQDGSWITEHVHVDENNFHLWFWHEELEVM